MTLNFNNVDQIKMLSILRFQLLSRLQVQVVEVVLAEVEAERELEAVVVVVERLEDSELVAADQKEFVAFVEFAAAVVVEAAVALPYVEEFDLEVVDSSSDVEESFLVEDVVEAFQDDSASYPSEDAFGERQASQHFEDVVHLK